MKHEQPQNRNWKLAFQGYAIHIFLVTVDCDQVEYKVFLPLVRK